MRFALICAAAALASTSVSIAGEPAPVAPAATAKDTTKAKKPRKVCRRETSTGSAIPKRVCRTVEEPAEQAKNEPAARTHSDDAHAADSTE